MTIGKTKKDISYYPYCKHSPQKPLQDNNPNKGMLVVLMLFIILLIPILPWKNSTNLFTIQNSMNTDSDIYSTWITPSNLIHTSDEGFVFVLKIQYLDNLCGDFKNKYVLVKTDREGQVQWNRLFGVPCINLQQTNDNGFLYLGGGVLIKTDSNGIVEWQRNYSEYMASRIICTNDNGYLMMSQEYCDQNITKLDSQGNIQWIKEFKFRDLHELVNIYQLRDEGYLVLGRKDGFYLIKLNQEGESDWKKTFTPENPLPYDHIPERQYMSLLETNDSGFLIAGVGGNFNRETYQWDLSFWMYRIDSTGKLEWKKTWKDWLSESSYDQVPAISAPIQTKQGDFIIASEIINENGDFDIGILKTNSIGGEIQRSTFGKKEVDEKIRDLIPINNQEFALIGTQKKIWFNSIYKKFSDEKTFLTRIGRNGELLWSYIYEIMPRDKGWVWDLVETQDKGFIVTGVTTDSIGPTDMWLAKTDDDGVLTWNKSYGGIGDDTARALVVTNENEYVLAGLTTSYGRGQADMWLVKTDAQGNIVWNQSYGSKHDEEAFYLDRTPDGGFLLAGTSFRDEIKPCHLYLVKTDNEGQEIWNKTYNVPYENFWSKEERCWPKKAVSQTPDGGVLFLYLNEYSNIQMIRTDSLGDIQWNRTLEYDFSGYCTEFHGMLHTSDNNYVLGISDEIYEGGWRSNLIKMDDMGNIKWSKLWYDDWGDIYDIKALILKDEKITTCIRFNIGVLQEKGWMISEIELNGSISWSENYSEHETNWPTGWYVDAKTHDIVDVIMSSDGNFIIAGYSDQSGFYMGDVRNPWLAKMNKSIDILWSHTYGAAGIYEMITIPNLVDFPLNQSTTTSTSSRFSDIELLLLPLIIGVVMRKKRKSKIF